MANETLAESVASELDVRQMPPCVFVLFGATGDLAARKIAPALYNLANGGFLGPNVAVLGVAPRARTDEQFRNEMLEAVSKFSRGGRADMDVWNRLASRWHYQVVQANSLDEYRAMGQRLGQMDQLYSTGGSRLFYLAMPPDRFGDVIGSMQEAGLAGPQRKDAFVRIVIEKPFGTDLASAKRLNDLLLTGFQEDQIFRIDHYLGKETVQNIMVFRFANAIFQPLFDRQFVDRVEITTAETVGMEGRRGEYYETAGAMRDMIQNHLLQLVALVAMEPPSCIKCSDIRDAKARVLQSISPLSAAEAARWTVRGQYEGYRQELAVSPDSQVETYAACRLFIQSKRWQGVPFYLRTGKKLAAKTSQIFLTFKRESGRILEDMSCDIRSPNRLCIRINPDEAIYLTFDAKVPGVRMLVRPVRMDFRYGSSFESASPEAYEQLLLDAACGESTLFIRNDEVEAAWKIVDSIRGGWHSGGLPPLETYEPGSWGPQNADRIFGDPYKHWQSF